MVTTILFLTIFFIVAVALIGYYASHETEKHENSSTKSEQIERPDYFILNAKISSFDDTGQLTELTAKTIEHSIALRKTNLVKPIIEQKAENDFSIISSDYGTLLAENNIIELQQNVILTHQKQADKPFDSQQYKAHPPLKVYTEFLKVFPNNEFATTKLPVTIIKGGTVINGIGMYADYRDNNITLLDNVRGKYEILF